MVQIIQARFPELELRTLADYPESPEPEETGSTYQENAAIKAISSTRFTGEWSVADDAGLEIDALDGAPGLYSKRFGGEDLPFPDKIARILDLMDGVPPERRTARFRCCVALESPDGESAVFEATCEGRIAESPMGTGGFGYDPIFLPNDTPGRTMADLTADEKHSISHRGKVLKAFGDYFSSL
jgi:XTP/dITP diphosphohydrolase